MAKQVNQQLLQGKITEILSGFSTGDIKEFGIFLKSPYFNSSETACRLYSFFRKRLAKGTLLEVTKMEIAEEIYSGTRSNNETDSNLRKLISNFTKLAEEFIIIKSVLKNANLRTSVLLRESTIRGYTKSFERYYKEAKKKLGSDILKPSEHYYFVMDAEQAYFQMNSKKLSAPEEQLGKISFALDLYYISIKLLHFYSVLNLRLHFKKQVEFDTWAFDEITNFVEKHCKLISEEHKSIYADFLSVKMLLNPDESERYEELRKFVFKNSGHFGEIEMHRMYIYLYNHSLYRFNKGYSKDVNELFGIISEMEKSDVPLWHYFAYHMYFINAVKYASMHGDYKWAEEFMKLRQDKIHTELRRETVSLAMANYNFYRGDPDSALRQLLSVDFPNYSFYIGAKTILLKIYFEGKEIEAALSQIDAIRHFLSRKDFIPERHSKQFGNFVNCISKLLNTDEEESLVVIRNVLKSDISATDRIWFEKLARNI